MQLEEIKVATENNRKAEGCFSIPVKNAQPLAGGGGDARMRAPLAPAPLGILDTFLTDHKFSLFGTMNSLIGYDNNSIYKVKLYATLKQGDNHGHA